MSTMRPITIPVVKAVINPMINPITKPMITPITHPMTNPIKPSITKSKILGTGEYGCVYELDEKKAVKRHDIGNDGVLPSTLIESDILMSSDHPNIIKCFNTIASLKNINENTIDYKITVSTVMEKCICSLSEWQYINIFPYFYNLDKDSEINEKEVNLREEENIKRAIPQKRVIPKIRSKEEILKTVIDYIFQIFSGINFLHENHIIHGDLKPQNILLSIVSKDNSTILDNNNDDENNNDENNNDNNNEDNNDYNNDNNNGDGDDDNNNNNDNDDGNDNDDNNGDNNDNNNNNNSKVVKLNLDEKNVKNLLGKSSLKIAETKFSETKSTKAKSTVNESEFKSSVIIKLIDFGLSQHIFNDQARRTTIQSAWYRAPEVILGDPYYDERVDIWSMGVLILKMIFDVMISVEKEDVIQILKDYVNVFGVPTCSEWSRLVEKCIQNNPAPNSGDVDFIAGAVHPLFCLFPYVITDPQNNLSFCSNTYIISDSKDNNIDSKDNNIDSKDNNIGKNDKDEKNSKDSKIEKECKSDKDEKNGKDNGNNKNDGNGKDNRNGKDKDSKFIINEDSKDVESKDVESKDVESKKSLLNEWIKTNYPNNYEIATELYGIENVLLFVDLIENCLSLVPTKRFTVFQALRHPLFSVNGFLPTMVPKGNYHTVMNSNSTFNSSPISFMNFKPDLDKNSEESSTALILAPQHKSSLLGSSMENKIRYNNQTKTGSDMEGKIRSSMEGKARSDTEGKARFNTEGKTKFTSKPSTNIKTTGRDSNMPGLNKSTNGVNAIPKSVIPKMIKKMEEFCKEFQWHINTFHISVDILGRVLKSRKINSMLMAKIISPFDLTISVLIISVVYNQGDVPLNGRLISSDLLKSIVIYGMGFEESDIDRFKMLQVIICNELGFIFISDECRRKLTPFHNYFFLKGD